MLKLLWSLKGTNTCATYASGTWGCQSRPLPCKITIRKHHLCHLTPSDIKKASQEFYMFVFNEHIPRVYIYIYIYVCVNYIKYLYIHMGPALLFVSFSSSTRRAKQYILICNMQSKWIVYFVSVILSGYTRNGCAKELGLERPCTSVPTPQKRHTQVKRPRLWELPISTIPRRLLWS